MALIKAGGVFPAGNLVYDFFVMNRDRHIAATQARNAGLARAFTLLLGLELLP